VVNNNLYNLTDYINSRSAEETVITDYCGKEATGIFRLETAESSLPPAGLTTDDLAKYYIGDLAR
jgi:cytochrome b involved in lipid metabolism